MCGLGLVPKVHIQVAMEDAICLRGVQVPDELSIFKRCGGRHHLETGQSARLIMLLSYNKTLTP